MGEKKVVLDTNIFISALGWNGKPRVVVQKGIAKEFILILPQKQIEELQKVIAYPKFQFTEYQKTRFLNLLIRIAVIVETQGKINIIKDDVYDNVLLEAAIGNKVSFLVSGDEDLLRLKQIEKTKIVTATEFLEVFKVE